MLLDVKLMEAKVGETPKMSIFRKKEKMTLNNWNGAVSPKNMSCHKTQAIHQIAPKIATSAKGMLQLQMALAFRVPQYQMARVSKVIF